MRVSDWPVFDLEIRPPFWVTEVTPKNLARVLGVTSPLVVSVSASRGHKIVMFCDKIDSGLGSLLPFEWARGHAKKV